MMRAADDGAGSGTASGTDAATGANIGAAGTGTSDTTGTAQRDAAASSSAGASDDTYDGLRNRVRALENELMELQTRPVPKAGDNFDNGSNIERFERLEAVLSGIFGREFANYDTEKLARANR